MAVLADYAPQLMPFLDGFRLVSLHMARAS
jgi:hypothetical protein